MGSSWLWRNCSRSRLRCFSPRLLSGIVRGSTITTTPTINCWHSTICKLWLLHFQKVRFLEKKVASKLLQPQCSYSYKLQKSVLAFHVFSFFIWTKIPTEEVIAGIRSSASASGPWHSATTTRRLFHVKTALKQQSFVLKMKFDLIIFL